MLLHLIMIIFPLLVVDEFQQQNLGSSSVFPWVQPSSFRYKVSVSSIPRSMVNSSGGIVYNEQLLSYDAGIYKTVDLTWRISSLTWRTFNQTSRISSEHIRNTSVIKIEMCSCVM